jgi:hypothetical protein
MAERDSELRILLPCPACGRSLIPAVVDVAVLFHCKNGHERSLEELLAAPSYTLRRGLEGLLASWYEEHLSLIGTVENARRNGYLDVAAIFNRHAESLGSRIKKVRAAISAHESSKLMKIPEELGSA